uniref:Uncharacterized protein n=1 Tax=Arundo donax TaxID=35708 RepID=A0A0A9BBW5_ARUDO
MCKVLFIMAIVLLSHFVCPNAGAYDISLECDQGQSVDQGYGTNTVDLVKEN